MMYDFYLLITLYGRAFYSCENKNQLEKNMSDSIMALETTIATLNGKILQLESMQKLKDKQLEELRTK